MHLTERMDDDSMGASISSRVTWEDGVAWVAPAFPQSEVSEAGQVLVNGPGTAMEHALDIIGNWRSSHSFPLNTFQVGLRDRVRRVDQNGLVAQRLKRLSSIEQKLRRFDWLTLSEMQDIGGCRAVVRSVRSVDRLVKAYRASRIRHHLVDHDDYIRNPKASGYRGYHLIYKYVSDRNRIYNDLKIEVQLRTQLQHAWATAVETVGTFTQQALKSSSGEKSWLRFFALMGSVIAERERSPLIPATPTDRDELLQDLRTLAVKLDVVERLHIYQQSLRVPEGHTGA